MTRSQRVEYATAAVVLLCVAGSLWRPSWTGLDETAVLALLAGASLSYQWRTAADRVRARQRAWLIPSVALALATQFVYFAAPGERSRMLLAGGALVAAGFGLYAARRRSV